MRSIIPIAAIGAAAAAAYAVSSSSRKKEEESKTQGGKSFSQTASPKKSRVKNKEGAKILYFHAKWCMVCRRVKPALRDIETKHPDIKFLHIDIDEKPAVADKYRIAGVPAFVGILDGKTIARKEGFKNKEDLQKKVVDRVSGSKALPEVKE